MNNILKRRRLEPWSLTVLVHSCLLTVCSTLCAAQRMDETALSSAIPANALLMVQFENLRNAISQLKATNLFRQFSENEWQSFFDAQKSAPSGSWLISRPWLGLEWNDLTLIDAPGMLVVTSSPKDELEILFLAQLGDLSTNHAIVQRWIENQGGNSQIERSQRDTWNILSRKTPTKSGDKPTIALSGNWSCLSASPAAVQRWIDLQQSKTQPKFEFGQTKSDSQRALLGRFWCAPWTLFQTYAKQKDPKLVKSGERFGFESIGTVQGRFIAPIENNEEWKIEYSLILPKQPQRGLALLSYAVGPAKVFPNVFGSQMDQIAQSYVDIKPWFQGVSHAVDMLIDEDTTGNFADLLDSILTDPEGPKVDLRKELIYRMGPLMMFGSESAPNSNTKGGFQKNQLWCCSLQDAKHAASVMEKLFHGDDEVKMTKLGNYTFWRTVNDQSLFIATSSKERNGITAAAMDDVYLYLSNNAQWLESQLLASSNTNTAQETRSDLFARFAKVNVEPMSSSQVLNVGAWLKTSWNRVPETSSPKDSSVDLVAWLLTKILVSESTTVRLPDLDKVNKYFGTVIHRCLRSENGIDGDFYYVDSLK